MATHKGSSGLVKNGSNTVAEVRTWTLNTNAAGLTSADASVDVFWDETDTNGQVALAPGSSVTLVLYPEGADSGDTYYTGTALVTSKSITGSFDGMVEASISATYTGAVTTATV